MGYLPLTRRELLQALTSSALVPYLPASPTSTIATQKKGGSAPLTSIAPDFENLLDEIEKRACRFFYEEAGPNTGIVKDRALADGDDTRQVGSIAATGFGLSALCIAESRGHLKPAEVKERVKTTLNFFAHKAQHEHGFFYHFLDIQSGERVWKCELSSIDSAWLFCGVVHAREYFRDPEITRLANEIVRRADWTWMMNDGLTLSHGWKPESGFLPHRWDTFSEHMAMDLLAIGSPSHPIPATEWDEWRRPQFEYGGIRYITGRAPLFIHQWSHAWFDFRNLRDKHTNYFENSMLATEAHKKFCLTLREQYPWFGEDMWGITSSDSQHGYKAWGGPPPLGPIDGTLVPCAAGGSVVFLPEDCGRVLLAIQKQYGDAIWKKYGFADAFNPGSRWVDKDVLGIDLGIMALMAENLRSQAVWNTFMQAPEAKNAIKAVFATY